MNNSISKELEEKIVNAESLDEIVALCAAEGIQVTKEQLEAELAMRSKDGELDENDLDAVAGGSGALVALGVIIAICVWQAKKEANEFAEGYGKNKTKNRRR